MSNSNDTFESEERDRRKRDEERFDARMEAYERGLCTLRAAEEGGDNYERQIADSALELKEAAASLDPVHAALAGWLGSQRTAHAIVGRAFIAPGIAVRVGTGRKRRAA